MTNALPRIFLLAYAATKWLLGKHITGKGILLYICTGILSVLLLAVIAILVAPFAVFRICLHIILKSIHGELYGGLLNGCDEIFEMTQNGSLANIMVIYSCKKGKQSRIEELKMCTERIHSSSYKLACSFNKLCGYHYLIKSQVKSEDVVEIVGDLGDGNITRSTLYDYIEENSVKLNRNHVWKLTGFLQPICWSIPADRESNQYVILITIRHSIADGPSIIGVLKHVLDEDSVNRNTEANSDANTVPYWPSLSLKNAYFCRGPLAEVKGGSLKLTGRSDWYFATYIEDSPRYLSLIKDIKKKLNARFMDVVSAAICSSVMNYVKQRGAAMDTITLFQTVRTDNQEIEEVAKGRYNFDEFVNGTSTLMYDVPFERVTDRMKNKILFFRDSNRNLRNSVDYLTLHTFLRDVCSYVPNGMLKYTFFRRLSGMGIGISNFVGFDKTTYLGSSIDDIFLYVPDLAEIGFMFFIFTYDKRLGLAVASGRGYTYNREETETVLNNVIKYIDQAQEELNSPSNIVD